MQPVTNSIKWGKTAYRHAILPRKYALRPSLERDPLVVAGMFRTYNGIGRAARACADALKQQGLSPKLVDLSEMFHQAETEDFAGLEPMPQSSRGTIILFANAPESQRALLGLRLRRWHDWRIIGGWAWELPVAPARWTRSATYHSDIWVPSEFVRDAVLPRVSCPVRTVPHYVPVQDEVRRRNSEFAAPDGTVQFLCMADGRSSFHRKNLTAAIRMFRLAFPDEQDVRLVIKCRNLHLYEAYAREIASAIDGDTRIVLIDRTLDFVDQTSLYLDSDVVVSTHRSEGFGMTMAEAMAMARPVMATAWSGNMQFMDEQNSVLLPYTFEPVRDPTGVYEECARSRWASVDEVAGIRAMQQLHASASLRQSLGEQARKDVATRLGSAAYVDALSELASGAGLNQYATGTN